MPDHAHNPRLQRLQPTEKTQRDLYWSLFGPALVDCAWAPNLNDWLPELDQHRVLTCSPTDIKFSSQRLGFRFEQLWHLALTQAGIPFTSNVQIQNRGQTLGELDLLIGDKTHTLHAELALKFYLGVEDDWIGPNRRDLLSQKLSHTLKHQLPLARSPQAKKTLDTLGLQVFQSIAVMRGCLFHPVHTSKVAPLPSEINKEHWRGNWCPLHLLRDYLPQGHWYVLSKQDWISPIVASFGLNNDELLNYLTTHFDRFTSELSIARVTKQGNLWYESERWMIVHPNWGC